MQTSSTVRHVESGGLQDQGSFSIKATGKAFRILSDGLYSDKPLAVVRELSCNAYDAHVAAGRQNIPFEIHLPNVMEPYLAVKDFGVGLSHEQVMKLYTTYFESTKGDSNDFIGALGLGSKSPFSYVDSFTVVSRFAGMKRTYTAFISPSGVPSIALLNEEQTREDNGVEVSTPVKQGDFNTFERAAAKALKRFNPCPIVRGASNFQLGKIEYALEAAGSWGFRKGRVVNRYGYDQYNRDQDGPIAIQGSVSYKIDKSALGTLAGWETQLLDSPLDLHFAIGELEVAASREALGYDPRTIKNIKATLARVYAELPAKFASEIDACPTLWEARKKLGQICKPLDYHLEQVLKEAATYKGRQLKGVYAATESHGRPDVWFASLSGKELQRVHVKLVNNNKISIDTTYEGTTIIYYDDGSRRNINQTLKLEFSRLEAAGKLPQNVYIVRAKSDAHRDEIFTELGQPKYQNISALPEPVKVTTARTKSEVRPLYRWRATTSSYEVPWENCQHDVMTGGYYVRLDNWNIIGPAGLTINRDTLAWVLQATDTIGHVIDRTKLFFIPGTYRNVPKKTDKWVDLWTDIKNAAIERLKDKSLKADISAAHCSSALSSNHVLLVAAKMTAKKFKPLEGSVFGPLTAEAKRLERAVEKAKATEQKRTAIEGLARHFSIDLEVPEFSSELTTLLSDGSPIQARYPLLWEYATPYGAGDEQIPNWMTYVNLLDAKA